MLKGQPWEIGCARIERRAVHDDHCCAVEAGERSRRDL